MPLPASWTLITVTATYTLRNGDPATGRVVFVSPQIVVVDGEIIVPRAVSADLDANGSISVQLPSTNDPDIAPTGWTWTVTEYVEGLHRDRWAFEVPYDGGPINLATVAPVEPVDEVVGVLPLAGGTLTGPLTVMPGAAGPQAAIVVGDGSVSREIELMSSYAGGQDTAANTQKFDSTSRINFYLYQQAFNQSYGEPLRFHMRKRDAKAALTWLGPTAFTDWEPDPENPNNLLGGDPIGPDRNWAWVVAHYEANNHGSVHGHISIETPDSNGFLQTRLEFLIFDTRQNPPTFGLDTTLIATNQASLVVRSGGTSTRFLRLQGASGSQRGIEFTTDIWGANRLWKLFADDAALSGGNVGADLRINRYSDTNVLLDTPLILFRSNGTFRLNNRVGINQDPDSVARLAITQAADQPMLRMVNTTSGGNTNQPHIYAEAADSASGIFWGARVTGDLASRFLATIGGELQWGDGTAARDTNLYRSSANRLGTDDDMAFLTSSRGVILRDRTTLALHRLLVDNGVLSIEAV